MRKTLAITLFALGMLIFIFCVAFTVVQITASETAWFEEEFSRLALAPEMNMTLGDLGASLRTLVDYMNGKTETIDVLVTVNGQQVRMFDLDIEIVHMSEVRDLWQWFTGARNVGLLLITVLCLLAVVLDGKNALRNACLGYLWALSLFLVLVIFTGTWAAMNFDSFWTAFHRLIFPDSENWLLPAQSRMIQMLPSELFRALVMRIGGRALAIFLALALVSGVMLAVLRRRQRQPEAAAAEDAPVREDSVAIQGPDLLAVHRKANMTVTERRKLNERLEKEKQAIGTPDEAIAAEFRDAALDTPVEARQRIEFAPIEGKPEEKDDDYDELL